MPEIDFCCKKYHRLYAIKNPVLPGFNFFTKALH